MKVLRGFASLHAGAAHHATKWRQAWGDSVWAGRHAESAEPTGSSDGWRGAGDRTAGLNAVFGWLERPLETIPYGFL